MRLSFAVFFAFYCTAVFAGTIDPSVPDEKYTSYGSKFKCVVSIGGDCKCGEGKEHKFGASAVAIKPNWILTAAHVVKKVENVTIWVSNKEVPVNKIIIKDDFVEGNFGQNDIALAYCEQDLGLDFYPDLYDKSDEASKIVSICGYGMTGTFNTGSTKVDGAKRAGSNKIDRVEKNCLICLNTDKRTELEFMIASGDSGGGLFIDGKLAGINSFVMAADGKPNSSWGDECAHSRISHYLDWINKTIEKHDKK
jgi:hypothetical protein